MSDFDAYKAGWEDAMKLIQKELMSAQREPHKEPADYGYGIVETLRKTSFDRARAYVVKTQKKT